MSSGTWIQAQAVCPMDLSSALQQGRTWPPQHPCPQAQCLAYVPASWKRRCFSLTCPLPFCWFFLSHKDTFLNLQGTFHLKKNLQENERQSRSRIPASDKPQVHRGLGDPSAQRGLCDPRLPNALSWKPPPCFWVFFRALHFFLVNTVWLKMPLCSQRLTGDR